MSDPYPINPNLSTLSQTMSGLSVSQSSVAPQSISPPVSMSSSPLNMSSATQPSSVTSAQSDTWSTTPMSHADMFRQYTLQAMTNAHVIDLVPTAGKVVVFDSELPVRHAFSALTSHHTNCGTVWDAHRQTFVGMLSVTDFIEMIVDTFDKRDQQEPSSDDAISGLRICQWQAVLKRRNASISRLLHTSPESTILEAVRLLVLYRVHRLAVVTDSLAHTVICVLSQHQILRYLLDLCIGQQQLASSTSVSQAQKQRALGMTDMEDDVTVNADPAFLASLSTGMTATIGEAMIGRHSGLMTVCTDTPVTDALRILLHNRISSLPVVEGSWNDRRVLVTEAKRTELNNVFWNRVNSAPRTGNTTDLTEIPAATALAVTVTAMAYSPQPAKCLQLMTRANVKRLAYDNILDQLNANITVGQLLTMDSAQTPTPAQTLQQEGLPEALLNLSSSPFPKCKYSDTLLDVCKTLFIYDKHQVVCVDDSGTLTGVVALTDIFCFVLELTLSSNRDVQQ